MVKLGLTSNNQPCQSVIVKHFGPVLGFDAECYIVVGGASIKEHRIANALHRNVRFPSCVLSWGPWLCQTKKEEKRWFESSKLSIPLDLKCEGMPTIFTIFHT